MVKLRFPRSPFKGSGAGAIASSSSSGLSSDGDNNTNPLANSGSEDFQLNINNSTRNATRSNRQHRRRQSVRRSQRIRHQQQRRLEQQQQQDRSLNSNIAFGASHNLNNRPTTPPITQRVASLASPFDPSPSQILPPAPHYNPPPSSRATGLRRPFDTLESSNTEATVARGSSSGLRRIFPGSSSSAKKKQVTTGGLSASFRRATSAVVQSISSSTSTTRPSSSSSMFRSSSVPAPHPVREESMGGEADVSGTAAIGSNLNDSVGDVMQGMLEHFDSFETEEGMDTSTDEDDGDHHNVMGIMRAVGVRPESHTQTSIDTYSSSQDENFPLLALLSPNSGTFFAHADAAAHVREYDHFKVDSMDTDCDALHTTISSLPQNKNVVDWMKDDAPRDVLPKILSFLGSRKMNALSKVNQAWNKIVKDESVWRVVCEDTRKVS